MPISREDYIRATTSRPAAEQPPLPAIPKMLPSRRRADLAQQVEAALVAGDVEKATQLVGRIYGRAGRGLSPIAKFALMALIAAVEEKNSSRALHIIRNLL